MLDIPKLNPKWYLQTTNAAKNRIPVSPGIDFIKLFGF